MTLQFAARQRWGNHCPCCGKQMQKPPRPRRFAPRALPRNTETQGHDASVAFGGDPKVWVTICWSCNNEQGELPFEVWARKLKREDDPRARRVAEVAMFIEHWLFKASLLRKHEEEVA